MKKAKFFLASMMVTSLLLSSCNKGFDNLALEETTKISSADSKDEAPLLENINKYIDQSLKESKNTYENKNLKLYIDGPQAYPALVDMILAAKKSVYVEVFQFHTDPTGQKVADALMQKAKEGLDVKFIYDFIGNPDVKIIQQMAKNGVQVQTYGKKDFSINASVTHRKLYIADGKVAMTGGMNIDKNFASSGLFHDVLMSYEGEAVKETMDEFFNDWELCGGKISTAMKELYEEPLAPIADGEKKYPIRLAITNPLKKNDIKKKQDIYKMFLAVLDNAKNSINIAMPYFTDDEFVNRIVSAKNRGVKVRVLIPNKTNLPLVTMANKMTINQLVKGGVEVYLGGKKDNSFNHAKVISADGVWSTIGSCNADARAFGKNQELNLAISDASFTKEVDSRFFDYFISQASKAEYENIPWYKKPAYSLVESLDFLL